MIKVENLTFSHNGTTPVLSRIDFQAQPGEVLTVLGPNGSGKTTLFQCILGTWKPREGGVLLSGKSVGNLRRPEIARMVAVVPQDHDPPFPYSAFDVVLMGRTAHVGLFSSPLVLLARCLAQQSPVMLLDEPTAHLDFRNQIMILSKVKELVKEKNLLSLMNLHDPNLALLFSDRVLLLDAGRLVAQGKPEEVVTRDNLMAVYGLEVEFLAGKGMRMICPKLFH